MLLEEHANWRERLTFDFGESCQRLRIRFDGEESGLLWFTDRKEDEPSCGSGFVIRTTVRQLEKSLEQKVYQVRQRFRS